MENYDYQKVDVTPDDLPADFQRKLTDKQYEVRARIYNILVAPDIFEKLLALLELKATLQPEDLMTEDAIAVNHLVDFEYYTNSNHLSRSEIADILLQGGYSDYINMVGTTAITPPVYREAEKARAMAHHFAHLLQTHGIKHAAFTLQYRDYKAYAVQKTQSTPPTENTDLEQHVKRDVRSLFFLQLANEYIVNHIRQVIETRCKKECRDLRTSGILADRKGLGDIAYFKFRCAKELAEAMCDHKFIDSI